MTKIYYGNGSCSIEGIDLVAIDIHYQGNIEINDKTSSSFILNATSSRIIICPIGQGTLNDLFDYVGEIRIVSVLVSDVNGNKVHTIIKKVMDFSELLNTNSEDMTTNSEDLNSTYRYNYKVPKTILKQSIVPNLNTLNHNGSLYLKDGSNYNGKFHVHLNDGMAMSGSEHTLDSQELYYYPIKNGISSAKLISTKNTSSIPQVSRLNRPNRKRRR